MNFKSRRGVGVRSLYSRSEPVFPRRGGILIQAGVVLGCLGLLVCLLLPAWAAVRESG